MAINRVLNAIWAEISARGSLIKTATNPYNPNPGGGGTTGANNQGMAAITSGSPFIVITQDGISPSIAVNTSLSTGGSIASPSTPPPSPPLPTPTPIDENSGAYLVTRQYGDIYLYNDGNIIMWGGNGKNFSFGNGYEENHAWANLACVYNNETFQIPIGALSPYTDPGAYSLLPSPPASNWEWLGGAVSKSWGNEYSYAYGSSYEWNGGPTNYVDAFGNTGNALTDVMQGKHCTFSYGTGYEESLVGWTNSSTWFHADDSSSPYKSRSYDTWASTNLGTGWTATNLLVSKAFGPTYDYHYGSTLSIQEGPSEERVYGASWSTVIGDSNETVNGNSTSNITGNSNETVTGNVTSKTTGNATETYWGTSDEYFMGGKSEMMLAGCDEINLAAKLEIVSGAATEIYLGAKFELALGAFIDAKAGASIGVTGGPNIETNALKVEANDTTQIEANASGITASFLKLFV